MKKIDSEAVGLDGKKGKPHDEEGVVEKDDLGERIKRYEMILSHKEEGEPKNTQNGK